MQRYEERGEDLLAMSFGERTLSTGTASARLRTVKAVGIDGKISETASISIVYGVSLEDGNGQIHTGQARIEVPL